MSLPAWTRRPDSPPVSQSTPVAGILLWITVNWGELGQTGWLGKGRGNGDNPKDKQNISPDTWKGVPIRPIWPNSAQLSQSTPMESTFSRGTGFWVWSKGCQKRPQVRKLKPTKVKRSEFPKSNNHHTVVYLGKAVTSKPKKIKNRGWSHFVALENFFPTIIWFLILKFFLTKL